MMKILFIGCVDSSRRLLQELIDEHKNVVGVITKKESNFNSDFFDLKPLCDQAHIPCCYVKNINDDDSMVFIKLLQPDIGFCFGWSQLLGETIINMFPQGVVGFHPAALPKNRGRHPIIWTLALGLTETASTFFMMSVGADEGDIVSQLRVPISYEDNAQTLYEKIMEKAVQQERELIKAFEKGTIQRIQQSIDDGNAWRKRRKADGEIDWRMSSRNIYNLVRSLSRPYVGAHFVYNGLEYKVWEVKEIKTDGLDNIEPGRVLGVTKETLDIKVGEGGIRLIEFEHIDVKEGEYIL